MPTPQALLSSKFRRRSGGKRLLVTARGAAKERNWPNHGNGQQSADKRVMGNGLPVSHSLRRPDSQQPQTIAQRLGRHRREPETQQACLSTLCLEHWAITVEGGERSGCAIAPLGDLAGREFGAGGPHRNRQPGKLPDKIELRRMRDGHRSAQRGSNGLLFVGCPPQHRATPGVHVLDVSGAVPVQSQHAIPVKGDVSPGILGELVVDHGANANRLRDGRPFIIRKFRGGSVDE